MREKKPFEPEAVWKENDMSDGKQVKAMVLILRTSGCVWAKKMGCTMCGYKNASLPKVTEEDLLKQIDFAMGKYKGEKFVKIYTSGSFLDENEIPKNVRKKIFENFSGCERILFESRPEFITEKVLSECPKTVTVALGLETHDPEIMKTCVRKGFTPQQCADAGRLVKKMGLSVRSYLLLKPPFLTEGNAIESAIESIKFADGFSDEISVNPVNVQNGTDVEKLWKKGDYRSPWIWSLIEVLKKCSGKTKARLMSSPSGGGTQRGVHNCGKCDLEALGAIEKFSFSQNPKDLSVKCECESKWKNYIQSEKILGTAANLEREFDGDLKMKG